MCRPDHFAIEYSINPWMDTSDRVDLQRAQEQWEQLHDTYVALGHEVLLIEPVPGLPDMVFTSTGATVAAGRAIGVRFAHPHRRPEEALLLSWLRKNGFPNAVLPAEINEGQGDLLPWSGGLLAGHPYRTQRSAHAEAARLLGVPVTSLELVDPRFYHLDTALTILDQTIAFLPRAFSESAQEGLRSLFPDAIECDEEDAAHLGLNAVCDGRHVVMTEEAPRLARRYCELGFEVVPLPFSQFRKSGGGIKSASLLLDWPGTDFASKH